MSDVWQQAKDGELTAPELGKAVAARIRSSNAWGRFGAAAEDLEAIANEFEECTDLEDIDNAMSELYDWGDCALDDHWNGRKRAWIETRLPKPCHQTAKENQ